MTASLITSGIVRTLLLPPSGLFLLALLGWAMQSRWPRTGRRVVVLALGALFFLCTGIGARLLVRPLENMTTPLTIGRDAPAQAIVVLAAGRFEQAVEYGGDDIPDYVALARLRYAAKLQHETGLPILVSGGNVSTHGVRASKADSMASALRNDFATPVRWVEGVSDTTAENAQFSARLLRQDGVSRILLVTDAMHMPRAKSVFEKAGLDVVAAPTMFLGSGFIAPADFAPSAEGLRRSYYALYEWTGLLLYRVRDGA